jgi:hypothetical protein
MTNPAIYSIDIVDTQTLEQPRAFSVDIVETHIPISLPLLYEINVSWLDYSVDNNALFCFGGF